MSSNKNHITLANYEEYFILYTDNELCDADKAMVEAFVLQHPPLADELDILLSTKLPAEESFFYDKEELLSPYMKATIAEEELLLYVDGELTPEQKNVVEQKITADTAYALQHALLMQTKLNATEVVAYPYKKELYRREERVRHFPLWMRVAAAVIILLLGSLFFLVNTHHATIVNPDVVTITPSPAKDPAKQPTITEQKKAPLLQQKDDPMVVKAPEAKKANRVEKKALIIDNKDRQKGDEIVTTDNGSRKNEPIHFNASHLTIQPTITDVALNKTITLMPVTSAQDSSYHKQNNPIQAPDTDWAVASEKKTRGKGFFRKVSRFIERNTGIGTANADNELLVGAVALKLK